MDVLLRRGHQPVDADLRINIIHQNFATNGIELLGNVRRARLLIQDGTSMNNVVKENVSQNKNSIR